MKADLEERMGRLLLSGRKQYLEKQWFGCRLRFHLTGSRLWEIESKDFWFLDEEGRVSRQLSADFQKIHYLVREVSAGSYELVRCLWTEKLAAVSCRIPSCIKKVCAESFSSEACRAKLEYIEFAEVPGLIEEGAFLFCKRLTGLVCSGGWETGRYRIIDSSEQGGMKGDRFLFDLDRHAVLFYLPTADRRKMRRCRVRLPEGTARIGAGAFSGALHVQKIYGVNEAILCWIGRYAFPAAGEGSDWVGLGGRLRPDCEIEQQDGKVLPYAVHIQCRRG